MAKREIQAGTTSRRERIFVADVSKTDGSGLTGLVYNTSGLTWKYIRDDQTALTTVTATTAAAGTWTSGGFVEIGGGIYEIGLPNAALASSTGVQLLLYGATNMAVTKIEIELTATNNQDAVRGGMTALPNANAAASGGLAINGVNSGTMTLAALTVSGAVSFGSTFGVAGAATFAAVSTSGLTTNIAGNITGNLSGSVGSVSGNIGGSLAGSIGSAPDSPTASKLLTAIQTDGHSGYQFTALALANASSGQALAGAAQAATSTTITLASAASSVDGYYVGQLVATTGGTGPNQTRTIIGYVGATRVATVDHDWATVPDNTTTYILPGINPAVLRSISITP